MRNYIYFLRFKGNNGITWGNFYFVEKAKDKLQNARMNGTFNGIEKWSIEKYNKYIDEINSYSNEK